MERTQIATIVCASASQCIELKYSTDLVSALNTSWFSESLATGDAKVAQSTTYRVQSHHHISQVPRNHPSISTSDPNTYRVVQRSKADDWYEIPEPLSKGFQTKRDPYSLNAVGVPKSSTLQSLKNLPIKKFTPITFTDEELANCTYAFFAPDVANQLTKKDGNLIASVFLVNQNIIVSDSKGKLTSVDCLDWPAWKVTMASLFPSFDGLNVWLENISCKLKSVSTMQERVRVIAKSFNVVKPFEVSVVSRSKSDPNGDCVFFIRNLNKSLDDALAIVWMNQEERAFLDYTTGPMFYLSSPWPKLSIPINLKFGSLVESRSFGNFFPSSSSLIEGLRLRATAVELLHTDPSRHAKKTSFGTLHFSDWHQTLSQIPGFFPALKQSIKTGFKKCPKGKERALVASVFNVTEQDVYKVKKNCYRVGNKSWCSGPDILVSSDGNIKPSE